MVFIIHSLCHRTTKAAIYLNIYLCFIYDSKRKKFLLSLNLVIAQQFYQSKLQDLFSIRRGSVKSYGNLKRIRCKL